MTLGKKIYRSTSIVSIKLMAIVVMVVLLINLIWQTYYDPEIAKILDPTFKDIVSFHLRHPYDLLSYIFFIFIPCIYYGFIRGISFYENGIYINRGAPFYNTIVRYENVSEYHIIHQKLLMSLKRIKEQDEIFFTIRNVDRAVAIFDQHGLTGKLKSKMRIPVNMNNKIMLLIFATGLAVAIGQTSLWLSRFLFR